MTKSKTISPSRRLLLLLMEKGEFASTFVLLAPSSADLSRVLICLLIFSNVDRASNPPASLPNPAPEASTTANQDRAERETAPSIPDEDLDRYFTEESPRRDFESRVVRLTTRLVWRKRIRFRRGRKRRQRRSFSLREEERRRNREFFLHSPSETFAFDLKRRRQNS